MTIRTLTLPSRVLRMCAMTATVIFLGVLPSEVPAADGSGSVNGYWKGLLPLPGAPGGKVRVQLTMAGVSKGRASCTVDIVDLDVFGVPCFDVRFADQLLTFRVPELGSGWSGMLAGDGSLNGTWTRKGPKGLQELPVTFSREAAPIEQPAFTAQDAATLQRMVRDWFAAFSAKDYSAIPRYFSVPDTQIGNGRTGIITDMTQLVDIWRRTRESLDDTNYSHTQVIAVRIIPRTATQAILNILWRRVNKDGSTFDEGAEFYLASRQSGQWRFDGGMNQDRDLFGKY